MTNFPSNSTVHTGPSTIDTLAHHVALLIKEQDDLRLCHSELLAYGIGSQTAEVLGRIRDLKAEIWAITDSLRTLDTPRRSTERRSSCSST